MTTLVPLIRNKSGDIADINNYRAVSLLYPTPLVLGVILACFQSKDYDCFYVHCAIVYKFA